MDKKIDARPMRDLEIDALAALEADSGPARSETMKQVGIVRNAADMQGLSFAQRGSTEDLTGYTSSTSVITDRFDSQTLTKMEVALERACRMLPVGGEEHPVRRHIATKILECAENDHHTLDELTEAATAAANEVRLAHDA